MAISVIASAVNGSATADTYPTITHGFTIQAGDVLVACVSEDSADNDMTSVDSLFTQAFEKNTAAPGDSYFMIAYRVATASEAETFSWTPTRKQSWVVSLRQFRGVDTTAVFDVAPAAGTTATGQSTTATAPDITIVTAGACAIHCVQVDSSSVVLSDPSNSYTGLAQSAYRCLGTAIREGLSAGAMGSSAMTLSASDDWAACQFALKPAATGIGTQVNIGDAWKSATAARINIGDSWKPVTGIQQNIGDVWKRVI